MIRLGNALIKSSRNLTNTEIRRCLSSAVAQPKENAVQDDKNRPNRSFMANIFRGEIESREIFPYPDVMSAERKEFTNSLVDPFEKFFTEVNDSAKNDQNSKIDDATLNTLWELGAFGIQVPEELGGLGLSNTEYARMCEIVGAYDLGVGITIGAHQSIGFKGILLYGTPEQRQKYLPRVSSEKYYAAFALTEPSSGSDAASIRTKATLSEDGKHYVLNGSKIWISNGGMAELMTVFARTDVVDPKTGEKKDKLTAFIVERAFGGLTNGAPEKKMGIKCSNTAEVYFDNCKVPIENVLGEVGEGFKVAMNILNNGRFGMGATLAGTMKQCIKQATEHANNRLQFGNKIKEYGAIQEKLARMAMLQYTTESMAYQISQNMDAGSQDYHLEAAISKVFASEAAWYVCDEAIQILGGMGFMMQTGLERVLRDLRIFRIFEGSNDILRLFVALTGIQYAGANLKEIQKAFKNPAANLGLIAKEVSKRAISKVGLGGSDLSSHVHPELQSYAKQTAECIDLFGQTVESLLVKHGKKIVHEQYLLNRLADSAIDIYASTVTLSRATRAAELNLPTAEHELSLTKAWCLEAADRCKINLRKATCNNQLELYRKMAEISKAVCENEGVKTTHII